MKLEYKTNSLGWELCPNCGNPIFSTVICTLPPISVDECRRCGYRAENGEVVNKGEERRAIENKDSINKELSASALYSRLAAENNVGETKMNDFYTWYCVVETTKYVDFAPNIRLDVGTFKAVEKNADSVKTLLRCGSDYCKEYVDGNVFEKKEEAETIALHRTIEKLQRVEEKLKR